MESATTNSKVKTHKPVTPIMLIEVIAGCLFKHEMPTDPAMLEKLGLRDIPRWYREKYGVPSMLQLGYTPRIQAPQEPLAIADQPEQKTITYDITPADNVGNASTENHHHRGTNGRYKPPRGPGFTADKPPRGPGYNGGKTRGNGHWYKNGHRNNGTGNSQVTPPRNALNSSNSSSPESFIDVVTNSSKFDSLSNESKAISGRSTVGSSTAVSSTVFPSFDGRSIAASAPVNASGLIRPQLFDDDGMPCRNLFSYRLQQLTKMQDIGRVTNNGEKSIFRSKSRRLFDFGGDGDGQIMTETDSTIPVGNMVTLGSLLTQLMEETISPHDVLLNFGPIGDDVEIPLSVQCGQIGLRLGPQFGDFVPRGSPMSTVLTRIWANSKDPQQSTNY